MINAIHGCFWMALRLLLCSFVRYRTILPHVSDSSDSVTCPTARVETIGATVDGGCASGGSLGFVER
jgi:hypothetical protein